MIARDTIRRVTFAHPFKLTGMKQMGLPGTFNIETHFKDPGVFAAHGNRDETTWIRICETPGLNGVLRMVKVDPGDLKRALRRDADRTKRSARVGQGAAPV